MIVKPSILIDNFFNEQTTCTKKNTMYVVKFGSFTKPIFKLDNCIVKYPVGKYGKLVIEHEYEELFKELNKKIIESLGNESNKFVEIKTNEIGLKVSKSLDNKLGSINKFDIVDVLVEFNNCWIISGKIYTSFTLKDIKVSKEVVDNEDIPFSFDDLETQ
jgi:hypothetical protein